jgi:hypothetical protein
MARKGTANGAKDANGSQRGRWLEQRGSHGWTRNDTEKNREWTRRTRMGASGDAGLSKEGATDGHGMTRKRTAKGAKGRG